MSDRYKVFSLGECNFHLAKRYYSAMSGVEDQGLSEKESGAGEGRRPTPEGSGDEVRRPTPEESGSGDEGPEEMDSGSSQDSFRPNERNFRRGAPFVHYTDYMYVGRDNSGCEFPRERGPRRYRVNVGDGQSFIYVVERSVEGSNHLDRVDLLACEHEGCTVFGYKFRGCIYHYGYHNHGYDETA